MTLLRRTIHACAFAAVGAAGFFAPEAAAYISPASVPSVIIQNTESATVRIDLENGLGSGVAIGGGSILTAAHVVVGAKDVKIKSPDGVSGSAQILWVNTDYDIALLRTDVQLPAADLSCKTAHVGDAIMAIGNPLGMEFISSFGRVGGAPREMGPWKSVFVTDLTVIMGSSGGPVFADGRLVGIVVGVLGVPGANESKSYLGLSTVVPSSIVCGLMGRA